jgi:hypothetical protein
MGSQIGTFVLLLVVAIVVAIGLSRADTGPDQIESTGVRRAGLRSILVCSAAVTGAQVFALVSLFAGERVHGGLIFVLVVFGGVLVNGLAMLFAMIMRQRDLARVFRFGMLFVIVHLFTTTWVAARLYGVSFSNT